MDLAYEIRYCRTKGLRQRGNRGFFPPKKRGNFLTLQKIIPFVHRGLVWNHYFHHPFWGGEFYPYFWWKHPYQYWVYEIAYVRGVICNSVCFIVSIYCSRWSSQILKSRESWFQMSFGYKHVPVFWFFPQYLEDFGSLGVGTHWSWFWDTTAVWRGCKQHLQTYPPNAEIIPSRSLT